MKKNSTKIELIAVTERLNDAIKSNGYKVVIGHRNGYTAIDLHSLETGAMLDYITAGLTDRSAIAYLHTMIKGIILVSNPIK